MAKKIFWGGMYLLAAALAVLAVYLYVIPEREIYVAEKIEGEKAPDWIDMPVYTVNGVGQRSEPHSSAAFWIPG